MEEYPDFNEVLQAESILYDLKSLNTNISGDEKLILYVNIRSLNANFNKLEVLIEAMINKPYVIICAETWNLEHHQFYQLEGYKMYYNHSKINKADGVVMYIKTNVVEKTEIVVVDRLRVLSSNIRINLDSTIEVSSLYRPHDLQKSEFIHSLKKYIRECSNIKNHYIVGDFNIDLMNLDNISQEYLNNFLENEYTPCFQTVTRPSDLHSSGTCIDNIFAKSKTIKQRSYKLHYAITDHFPLIISLDKIALKQDYNTNDTYINYNKLIKVADKVNWTAVLSVQDPEVAINALITKIKNCIQTVTTQTKRKKNFIKPRKKWITKGIIISTETKLSLYNVWRQNPTNEVLKNEYKKYTKILEKCIKEAKNNHEKREVDRNSQNPKGLWRIINSKLNKRKNKNNTVTIKSIRQNNQMLTDPSEISNTLNTYFCNIGVELSNKIDTPTNQRMVLPPNNCNSIFLNPTNRDEVAAIIKNMKNKAGGVDNINVKTLKTLSKYIIDPLTHIFNLCIEKSIWPQCLKEAEIVPIFKAGNKQSSSNYRPISLISNIAKIF